jgi:leader peptidase (prepilin peptidase)/N-methyltransferase
MGRTSDGTLRDPDALGLFEKPPGLRLHGTYLTVQVLVLVLFLVAALRFADLSWAVLVPYLAWFTAFVALAVIDYRERRLPDRIVLPAFAIGLVLVVVVSVALGNAAAIRYALIGAGVYFGFLFVLHMIYPGFAGFGDVKMALAVGSAIGWVPGLYSGSYVDSVILVFYAVLASFVCSSIIGIGLIAARGLRTARSQRIGLGPWLVAGAVLVIAFSAALVGS